MVLYDGRPPWNRGAPSRAHGILSKILTSHGDLAVKSHRTRCKFHFAENLREVWSRVSWLKFRKRQCTNDEVAWIRPDIGEGKVLLQGKEKDVTMQRTPMYEDLLLRRQTVCYTNISMKDKADLTLDIEQHRRNWAWKGGWPRGWKVRRKPWISQRSCWRRRRFVFSRLTSSTTSSTTIRLRSDDSLRPVIL